jgi:hypothetical protein
MGLGNTFTNAIVREIGRNYGKAISNSLMGNIHSTPISVTSSNSIKKSGGYNYETKLDEYLEKFEVKGVVATFNSGQNMYNAFFELVSTAKDDNQISLYEISYLAEKVVDTTKGLIKVENALIELGDKEKAEIISQKKTDLYEFLEELDNGLIVDGLSLPPLSTLQKMAFPLSLLALDRIILFPKLFGSYFWSAFGLGSIYLSTNYSSSPKHWFYVLVVYTLLVNPISKGGIWKLLDLRKNEMRTIELAKQLKETLRLLLKK